jgi:protein-S-isoprenylcysteine O-methyltransferase Ste14
MYQSKNVYRSHNTHVSILTDYNVAKFKPLDINGSCPHPQGMNPMSLLTISRILAILMLINEVIVVARTPAEDRKHIILPPLSPLPILMLFIPFFVVLDLPTWLAAIALVLQAVGLIIEVGAELQLARAKSFSVVSDKGTQPQTVGFYRLFEHPIYVGILLQMIGWSLWMPLVFVAVALNYVVIRKMIRNEREYLARALNFTHQGIDTPVWG